jgi:hypothetical protein
MLQHSLYFNRCQTLPKKDMKHIYLLILFISSSLSFSQKKDIKWLENSRLTWQNFKGIPEEKSEGKAKTTYQIEIVPANVQIDEFGNIINYKKIHTIALFKTEKSWSKEKKEDSYLLKHEQLHFDIAELFCRKINLKFRELQSNNIKNFDTYQNAYSSLWNECRKYQKEYDFETYHGFFKDTNNEWILKIKSELNNITIK